MPTIPQQEQVLAELKEYARKEPRPHDCKKVEMVIEYLSALNLFFEQGLLGEKVRVFDPCGKTIQRMERGFQFFSHWMEELISQGEYLHNCPHAGFIQRGAGALRSPQNHVIIALKQGLIPKAFVL